MTACCQNPVDKSCDEETSASILQYLDKYIVLQAKRLLYRQAPISHSAVLDLEVDELVQRTRIKFWRTLEKQHILSPRSYVRRVLYSELIDMRRQQKLLLPLPTEEGEDGYRREVTAHLAENVPDPAKVVEQQMECASRLNETIRMVLALPPRQQRAMICELKDKVDDLAQLIDAFREHKTNIELLQWPTEKAEKQVLRSSLAAARRSLAKAMKAYSASHEMSL